MLSLSQVGSSRQISSMYFMWASIGTSNGGGLNRHPAEDYLTWSMPPDASTAVEAVYRSDWGRIVATLIRLVRDFDVAEEAAQEAFAAAVGQWRAPPVPPFPRARVIPTAPPQAPPPPPPPTPLAGETEAPPPAPGRPAPPAPGLAAGAHPPH